MNITKSSNKVETADEIIARYCQGTSGDNDESHRPLTQMVIICGVPQINKTIMVVPGERTILARPGDDRFEECCEIMSKMGLIVVDGKVKFTDLGLVVQTWYDGNIHTVRIRMDNALETLRNVDFIIPE